MRLLVPDLAALEAALQGPDALSAALGGCDVAEGWNGFPEALSAARDALAADPASARWGTRLFVIDEPPTLVGWGGFKGPPADGVVELGYEIAPAHRGRGLASAAVEEMLREAFDTPQVDSVIAHTLSEPGPSTRVLEKTGFDRVGEVADDQVGTAWRWRLSRSVFDS
jgi:RimJ/RimL family protein N-acetyltransferase